MPEHLVAFSQYLTELHHPQLMEDQTPLHLDFPISLEVDGNVEPTQQQLEQAVVGVDRGEKQNGEYQVQLTLITSYNV